MVLPSHIRSWNLSRVGIWLETSKGDSVEESHFLEFPQVSCNLFGIYIHKVLQDLNFVLYTLETSCYAKALRIQTLVIRSHPHRPIVILSLLHFSQLLVPAASSTVPKYYFSIWCCGNMEAKRRCINGHHRCRDTGLEGKSLGCWESR